MAERTNANLDIDPTSPYYIQPNENYGAVLVSNLLIGSNYNSWSRAMIFALKTRNKLQFINGTIPRPRSGEALFPAWVRCNILVLSWIDHSLHRYISQNVLWQVRATEEWNYLKERFYKGGRCEACPQYDLCNACYQKELDGTDHTPVPVVDIQDNEAREHTEFESVEFHDLIIVHSSKCNARHYCQYPNCGTVKSIFSHALRCMIRAPQGCTICLKARYLIRIHCAFCRLQESQCRVLYCRRFKEMSRATDIASSSRTG